MLTDRERERYRRQIALFGVEAQERLARARVGIVGAGGLGCPAALYLAATGIGEIRLVDGDVMDLTNLNRRVLHADRDIGLIQANEVIKYITGDLLTDRRLVRDGWAAAMTTLPVERQEDCSVCGIDRC